MKGKFGDYANDPDRECARLIALEDQRRQHKAETLEWISVFALSTLRHAWRRGSGSTRQYYRPAVESGQIDTSTTK